MIRIDDYKNIEKAVRFFEEFSLIPHGSGNTSLIADYFVDFAKKRGLEYYRDEADNVIIRKKATKGYESRPAVIFQGHLDMVAEKKPGATIDMAKEGLTLYRDGDFLRAKDTTLGGDDGVALAYALAVLDSDDISHPDFEAVFTSDEEIGLLGAVAIDPDQIKGRLLINIDSDEEGVFTVGCAGGMRSDITLHVTREECNFDSYRVKAYGFKGGHSGVEIDKGRVNATKALVEILANIGDIRIKDIRGGNADNAIPRECECIFSACEDKTELIEKLGRDLANRYADIEPDIQVKVEKVDSALDPLTEKDSLKLISLLEKLPSGIIAMSTDVEGLVETSLNMGILRIDGDKAEVSFSVRSAKGTEKATLGERLRSIAGVHGAEYSTRGEYPAWEYKQDSHLRDVMKSVYERMYKKSPEIVIIHAGLECGIFSEKIEGLDCVSIGPNNYDIHTTEERLSLKSMSDVWNFLIEVLKEI
ncbi:MAG: aminoacyl-histidine dipeptidase [Clostridia bacterium]|nr:aminoacyl-histidine dipeptidase [Clostridia bacterium]